MWLELIQCLISATKPWALAGAVFQILPRLPPLFRKLGDCCAERAGRGGRMRLFDSRGNAGIAARRPRTQLTNLAIRQAPSAERKNSPGPFAATSTPRLSERKEQRWKPLSFTACR